MAQQIESSGFFTVLGQRLLRRQSSADRAAGEKAEALVPYARLQQMLAASPAVIYTTRATGDCGCTFVSDNLRTVIGYSPAEMTTDPKHWPDNLHPQDAAHVIDKVTALIEHGGGSVDYRFRHKDGHYIWVQDTFKVMRDKAGQPLELVGAWTDISERKMAQDLLQKSYAEMEQRVEARTEELEERQRRLTYVLTVSPAITYITNATGDFACTFVSASSQQIMGYTPEEMLAGPNFWMNHLHPQDAPRVLTEFERLIGQGGGILEYRFLHKGGHYRWFQDTFQVLRDGNGDPSEIVGSWADITHRKLAEAVHELYSASLEQRSPVPLKRLDSILEGGREVLSLDRLSILRADPAQQWLQAIATTGTQEPMQEIRVPIGPEGGGLAEAYLNRKTIVSDAAMPVPATLRLKPPYDQIKSLRSRDFVIVPLIVQDEAVGVLAADRKLSRIPFEPATIESLKGLATQAAIALEHTRLYAEAQPVIRRSLQLSEVYPAFARAVRALLPYDRIGVVVPDKKGLVMALSVAEPPLASWQGQVWQDVEGTAIEWVLNNAGPLIVKDHLVEQNFSESKFVAEEGVRSTLMMPLLAGGATVGVFFLDSCTKGAYTDEDVNLVDPVAQQLGLAIDNTRLFQDIEEKSHQLELANKHKSQFLANMSHELRTPLNAILGYSELILDGVYGDVPERARDVLLRVEKNGRHLLGLINDVLDLSKIEAGSIKLACSDYSMNEAVKTAIATVDSLATEKKLALKSEVPTDLPRAVGDERLTTQVLLNLLGNAIKFTDAGEVKLNVSAADGVFQFSVTDTGAGIAPEDQRKIFEEFHQADIVRVSKKGGAGLGLAISKRIVELQGGHIWVESAPGKGSTFFFTLPVHVEQSAEAA